MTQRELTTKLNIASFKYYRGENTEYTDTEFDLALKELQKMEKESGIIYSDSPTMRVGSDLQKEFGKIKHPIPMLTIENTYTTEGLDEWANKMHKEYGVDKFDAEIKYDGISCELHYKNGVYADASTRGNKIIGDDITLNVYGVHDVPFTIRGFNEIEDFRVRGEILMPKSVLASINKERESIGEQSFANTRNACAGSIKQLDPNVTASRGLIFRAWDCYGDCGEFSSMEEKHFFLKAIGFKYEFTPSILGYKGISEMVDSTKRTIDSLNLDYDYDGIVVKVNSIDIQKKIGIKDTRAIEWGIARKWNEQYETWTSLRGVEWQVGRTGVVTPVGLLEPVECNGVVISNVTLHNADFIENLDLHIGNDLKITRSGGVIPYVLECKHDLLMEMHNAHPKVEIPTVCPSCGSPLVKDGALLKCVNEECPCIIKGKIIQFCSKDCMDIQIIGEKIVDDLVEKLGIKKVDELYSYVLNPNLNLNKMMESLGRGYGELKCKKIINSIKESIKKPFENVLAGVSIPNVGKVTARILANTFKNYENLKNATVDDLINIEGIGEINGNGIYNWLHNEENDKMMLSLKEYGLYMAIEEKEEENNSSLLANLSVVFSGKSTRFSGDEVEAFLESNGAKCSHSVSSKTNYLITGEKPGVSKVSKAESLGVEIISENDFYKKYNL
jgi:DNA ligase (NAD+)